MIRNTASYKWYLPVADAPGSPTDPRGSDCNSDKPNYLYDILISLSREICKSPRNKHHSSGEGTWTGEMTAKTGTYRWMSPEVLEHKLYDHKVDAYSFSIMMWEVLTGGVPYDGFTPLQAAIGVVQQSDSAFFTWGLRPEIPPFVPEKLFLLAQQCWHQDPKQRPEFSEVKMIEHCLFCKSCRVEFSLPQPRFCSHCGDLHNSKGMPAPSVTLPSPAQGDSPEVALTEYEKLQNQNIQRNKEKLESLNLSSMPLKTPTFKNPKQKTPKGTEATMKMALQKLKAIAPHQ